MFLRRFPRLFAGLLVFAPSLVLAVDLPLRLNCGGPDTAGWVSDARWAKGGAPFTFGPGHDLSAAVSPAPARVYETVRHQDHRYEIPVAPGRYLVRFHFTDGLDAGGRAMDYRLNGNPVIDDLNIRATAGSTRKALVLEAAVEVKPGQPLRIDATHDRGNDVFQAGIEILAAPGATIPTAPVNTRPDPRKPPSKPASAGEAALAVRALTGSPTRIVWLQGTTYQSYTDGRSRVRLTGLDTEDNLGEHALMEAEGAYSKPLFTSDGTRVVYSDRKNNRVWIIGWDGSNRRDLGAGFASEVWLDPQSGLEWVYLRVGAGRKGDPIVRRRIDQPGIEEKVWDRTPNGHDGVPWFQLSADGKRFADAFPWSACGVADLVRGEWKQTGQGCWPAMAPDNSYRMFYFDGNHTHLNMLEDGGRAKRQINVSTMPGSKGAKVYHPRWSNHVRFLTLTTPEGSPRNELYLGRFDAGWNSIEAWARVTTNDRTEMFGDAWIKPGPGTPAGSILARTEPVETAAPVPKLGDEWPGASEGVAWIWKSATSPNEAPPLPGETRPHTCLGEFTNRARLGRNQELLLDEGAFVAPGESSARLLKACQASDQLSVEAVITSFAGRQKGPARIISFSGSSSARNFTLGQEEDQLIFRLRTTATDPNGATRQMTLGPLPAGKPVHVLVSYQPGRLVCYLDGQEAFTSQGLEGTFSNWEPFPFLLGDETGGGRDWKGSLEHVAVYNRFIGAKEAAHHHRLANADLVRRRPVTALEIEGTLLKSTAVPRPGEIAPYRRALVENVYQIRKQVSGPAPGADQIVALQWAIMDGRPLRFPAKPGDSVRLMLEPADAHPELEGEYRSAEHTALDAPVFLDVRSHLGPAEP